MSECTTPLRCLVTTQGDELCGLRMSQVETAWNTITSEGQREQFVSNGWNKYKATFLWCIWSRPLHFHLIKLTETWSDSHVVQLIHMTIHKGIYHSETCNNDVVIPVTLVTGLSSSMLTQKCEDWRGTEAETPNSAQHNRFHSFHTATKHSLSQHWLIIHFS